MQLIPSKRTATPTPATGSTAVKGMEAVGVIVVFMGFGWLIDAALDTRPWFMIGFVVLAFVGQFVRSWYAYDAEMRTHEKQIGRPR